MSDINIYLNGPDALKAEVLKVHADSFFNKNKVWELNQLVASQKREIAKLHEQILDMKKAGSYSESEQGQMLLEVLEDRIPNDRVTKQRKEIAYLHAKIKRLESGNG